VVTNYLAPCAAVLITQGVMKKLKKDQLCDELKKRGVPFADLLKDDCLKLLKKSILLPVNDSWVPAPVPEDEVVGGFPESAYWKQLHAEEQPVPEPNNRFGAARAPTVPEDESSEGPVNTNFAEHFDRPPFIGGIKTAKRQTNGRLKKDEYTVSTISKGRVRQESLAKHGLGAFSDPVDWMAPFWPRSADPGKFSIGLCTTNSNHKASLINAGPSGLIYYSRFTNFTVDEIQKFQGIHIAQGLTHHRGLR
jgi:hypothetical protein